MITNSLDIAAVFAADRRVELTLTGGDWYPDGKLLAGSVALSALADRAKFGSISPHLVAPLTDLYAVAIDDRAAAEALRAAGLPHVLQASNAPPVESTPG